MSSAAILSIKPQYADRILDGSKTIELRRSSMGLKRGDVVLVYVSSPEQKLAFWFRVAEVERLPVDEMWRRHAEHLGIPKPDFDAYFAGANAAVGLHVGQVCRLDPPIPLSTIQQLVPGFVPPQGMIWLNEGPSRFEQLVGSLSCPLPRDVFPQESLRFA
jgi:predicted transcriptional regulator